MERMWIMLDKNFKDIISNIKEEIMNNPDKYYMAPTEEDKKGIKK